jgi:metal-sulfur cluster biosynthetic enzyme
MSQSMAADVLDALRDVLDPEIGLNVVDLGLVYRAEVIDGRAEVALTMTSRACPLGESIVAEAKAAIRRRVAGIHEIHVDLVWEPAWQPSMMSDVARRRLGRT